MTGFESLTSGVGIWYLEGILYFCLFNTNADYLVVTEFFNGTTRPLFRFIFSSSRQIMQFYNKIMWRVSIQRWESNWPSDYESPPLTTRPGPRPSFLIGWLLTWSCSYGSEAFDWEVIGILVFCYQTDFFAVISCKKCTKNKRNSGPDSTYLKKALSTSLEPKSSTNLTIPCLVCISL